MRPGERDGCQFHVSCNSCCNPAIGTRLTKGDSRIHAEVTRATDTLAFATIAAGLIGFSLVSKRVWPTIVTGPMIFTGFGLVIGGAVLGVADLDLDFDPSVSSTSPLPTVGAPRALKA